MIQIDIKTSLPNGIYSDLFRSWAEATLKFFDLPAENDVSIVISDNELIRDLNNRYLGLNEPTDVLAFPDKQIDPDTDRMHLGDIIISYPFASKHAAELGHPVEDEIRLLIVHGILHLLEFDHTTVDDKKRMWKIQTEILHIFGQTSLID